MPHIGKLTGTADVSEENVCCKGSYLNLAFLQLMSFATIPSDSQFYPCQDSLQAVEEICRVLAARQITAVDP